MKRTRRVFSAEFKAKAVKLIKAGGKDVTQIARELDVSRQTLHSWVRQSDRSAGKALTDIFPGHGKRTAEQMELDRLRRENERLRMSVEILKKAKAFFAKHHR